MADQNFQGSPKQDSLLLRLLAGAGLGVVGGLSALGLVVLVLVLVLGAALFFLLGGWFAKLVGLFMLGGVAFALYDYMTSKPAEAPVVDPLQREIGRNQSPLGEAGFAYLEELARHKLTLGTFDDRWRKVVWLGRAHNVEWNAGRFTTEYPEGVGQPYGVSGSAFALGYSGENNMVTIGSAGAGKNATAIMPTLMLNGESVFVNDIKGENWWVTHAWRQQQGQRIICLNPFNLFGEELGFTQPMTSHYNPLAALSDGNHPKFGQRISGLANALIVAEGNEPHWSSRARDAVSCLMAIVATSPDEQRAGTNHLPRVMDLLSLPHASRYQMDGDKPALDASGKPILLQQGLADYLAAALKWCKLPVVINNAEFMRDGGKEFSSVISTAKGQLSFLNDPALRSFLSKSDFDFSDLRKERMTIYCMIPPAEMQTYFRFVRVLVQACLDTLAASPMTERDSVLVILDEQAKLRGMEVIETSAATLRGYNVRIWSVYQDLNQIKRDYEKSWETFIANAGVVDILRVNDDTTAEYFSRKGGEVGVTVQNTSVSHNTGGSQSQSPSGMGHGSSSGTTTSSSTSQQKTREFPPQFFYGLRDDAAISFVQGLAYPVAHERRGYFNDDEIFGRRYMFTPDHPPQGVGVADCWQWMKNATAAAREAQASPYDAARAEFYQGKVAGGAS